MNDKQFAELYQLIKDAFIEMQELVTTSKDNNKYIHPLYEFPKLVEFRENGMPRLTTYFFTDAPKDYTSLFTSKDVEHYYYYETIPSFKRILDYYSTNVDAFKEHPFFSEIDKREKLYHLLFSMDILDAFDCYMHEVGDGGFSENVFRKITLRLYNRFFCEELPISICIPILLIRFEGDEIEVSDSIRIRRLNEAEIISSYRIGGYSDTDQLALISSATHVLELQNYHFDNAPIIYTSAWDYEEAYPTEVIDKWFAAFRIITHYDTGYGQILSLPNEWGVKKGNLIDIHGTKAQKYPSAFLKNRKDIDPTPLISADELENVGKLFCALHDNKEKALNIAIKRLNMAYLRESDEDTIIDLMIGIEALVTKDDLGEITYKVATRTALILSTLPEYPYTITQTFGFVKQLYKFRSKVVHGETITDKLRVVKLREDISIASVDLARMVLENLILVIAFHPEFSDPNSIDTFFLDRYAKMYEGTVTEGLEDD